MSYTVLGDYLATKDKATVEQAFRQYIAIYGTDDIGNEAWPTYSFALLGKSEPIYVHKEYKLWSVKIELLWGYIWFNRAEQDGETRMSYWHHIDNSKRVVGDKEYLSDPIEIKAWFNKHFSNFVKEYMQHEQDV